MKVGTALINIIAIVFVLIWFSITITQKEQMDDFYYSNALKIKTERAARAAMWNYIDNKLFWLDTYETMMCNSYNMAETKISKDRIIDSVDAAIFISNSTVETLLSDPEIQDYNVKMVPIVFDVSSNEKIVVDLFSDKIKYLNTTNDLLAEANDIDELQTMLAVRGIVIDKDDILRRKMIEATEIINKSLLLSYRSMNIDVEHISYLPVKDIEALGINAIKGRSLIIVQKDFKRWHDRIITMAGYKKIEREWIVGFIENGVKYYCRSKEAPESIANAPGNKMFKSIYEAAEEGYLPALQYMQ